MCFLRYFLHNAKSNISSPLQGVSRFCKPRISAPLRGFSAACGGYPCCCRNNCFAASRHFPAAKPPFECSLTGTFPLLLKKQDKTWGVGAPPLPVHAKRVFRLLRKHSQAAKPPFGRSPSGTFHCMESINPQKTRIFIKFLFFALAMG